MIFDNGDDEIDVRDILRVASGCVRRDFSRWAAYVGITNEHFTGWVRDIVHMGVAVAYAQIDKWDSTRAKKFSKWACLKVEEQAREDLKKRTRRLHKKSKVDLALQEELMKRSEIDGFEDCLRRNSLQGVLQRLSPSQQEVVALYYIAGLTDTEIAQFKKIKLGTVHSLRQRALAEARKYYVFLHSTHKTDSEIPTPPARRNRKPRDNPADGDPDGDRHNRENQA
jgi:RNA polymerase sigma factor (sigma-70 family)